MPTESSPRYESVIAVIDRLTAVGGILGALSLLGILGLISAELAARNVLGTTIHFSWDLAGYLMGACFMLSAADALRSGSHVRVTAVTEMLSPRGAPALDLVACLIGLATSVALSWALIEITWLSAARGSTAATAWRVPLVYPQAVLAAGAVLLGLQCVAQLLRLLRGERLAAGEGIE